MVFFHWADAAKAQAVMLACFEDEEHRAGGRTLVGVLLVDRPDTDEPEQGESQVVLRVEVDGEAAQFQKYLVPETTNAWVIPAEFLNDEARVLMNDFD
jgi:hypothetical protein